MLNLIKVNDKMLEREIMGISELQGLNKEIGEFYKNLSPKELFYLINKLTLIKTIGIIFLIGNDTGRPPHCGAEKCKPTNTK
jgi:hypothetical protein